MSKFEEIETNRERFLCLLYRKSEGKAMALINRDEIKGELGFDLDMFERIIAHFRERGYIDATASSVYLTYKGADEATKLCEGK
jgi:hypothetical protein